MLPEKYLRELCLKHNVLATMNPSRPYGAQVSIFVPQNPHHGSYWTTMAHLHNLKNLLTELLDNIEDDYQADVYLDQLEEYVGWTF